LPDAVVEVAGQSVVTDESGGFWLAEVPADTIRISRLAWMPAEIEWDGSGVVDVALDPRVVRALRAIPAVAGDPDQFEDLLTLADASAVNALIFDTKDETGKVRYATDVAAAHSLNAINVTYDPVEAIELAHQRGLYAITRVVTFEDEVWTANDPDAKLAWHWVDPANPANWEYPLGLAVEACELGFDEIQFDYVRFPAGRTAEIARSRIPATADDRVAAIHAFLTEARTRLHPMGCALSADIFAIVVSSPTDEGIGQRPEDLSQAVDAISPMVYPSHYSPGWLGFPDPNDHPGPVTADAIEDALPRLAPGTVLRPWLQAFYYTPAQILEGINEAESRDVGWMLWHAGGVYRLAALPEPPP
jgi:hypothetical protein